MSQVKPVLKWAGGKQALAGLLTGHFAPFVGRFFEPFIGGGSVLFRLRPARAVVGDLNHWLLDCYLAIRDEWKRVATILDTLPNTRGDYLRIRSVRPDTLGLYERAAYLIYLNKTCFRGLFRVNRSGQFNVPYGEYRRRYYDPANLRAVAQALKNVEIRPGDFELCLQDVGNKDFVYFDPPYYKLGGYSDFNRYTPFQFRENDHIRLAAVCRELDKRKVRWAVSNSNTAFVRSLFDGYTFLTISNRREINLNPRDRNVKELLIVNYSESQDLPLYQFTSGR
jgi:DNA adenine methylase